MLRVAPADAYTDQALEHFHQENGWGSRMAFNYDSASREIIVLYGRQAKQIAIDLNQVLIEDASREPNFAFSPMGNVAVLVSDMFDAASHDWDHVFLVARNGEPNEFWAVIGGPSSLALRVGIEMANFWEEATRRLPYSHAEWARKGGAQ